MGMQKKVHRRRGRVNQATFRFFGELNTLLPQKKKHAPSSYFFIGHPGIKDGIEAHGVPHPLVFLILVNNQRVDFSYRLRDGDSVSIYPPFRTLPVPDEMGVIPSYSGEFRFILDDHLGRLARYLRQLGFDTRYSSRAHDKEILRFAREENRIILTKDHLLLRHKEVRYGYLIQENDPREQLEEVLGHYNLYSCIHPLGRCLLCNEILKRVCKEEILPRLKPLTKKYYQEFLWCSCCEKVYWKGSHYQGMMALVEELRKKKEKRP